MAEKVLVAYASKYGATKEIAEKVGLVLKDAGFAVDVLPADRVAAIAPYRAVVLGSAVYIGGWRKAAARFLKDNETALAPEAGLAVLQRPDGPGRPRRADQGLALPPDAAARGRPHQARAGRSVPGGGGHRQSRLFRPAGHQERQGAGRRLPRLGRHLHVGRGHRRRPQEEGIELALGEWTCPGGYCIITPFLNRWNHFPHSQSHTIAS